MRINTKPEIRGQYYYDVGDRVVYSAMEWTVQYAYPVRHDGERQSLTLTRATEPHGSPYYVSTSNTDVRPVKES
jgi:hypothetical protein